jgi:hypothetical protein
MQMQEESVFIEEENLIKQADSPVASVYNSLKCLTDSCLLIRLLRRVFEKVDERPISFDETLFNEVKDALAMYDASGPSTLDSGSIAFFASTLLENGWLEHDFVIALFLCFKFLQYVRNF